MAATTQASSLALLCQTLFAWSRVQPVWSERWVYFFPFARWYSTPPPPTPGVSQLNFLGCESVSFVKQCLFALFLRGGGGLVNRLLGIIFLSSRLLDDRCVSVVQKVSHLVGCRFVSLWFCQSVNESGRQSAWVKPLLSHPVVVYQLNCRILSNYFIHVICSCG